MGLRRRRGRLAEGLDDPARSSLRVSLAARVGTPGTCDAAEVLLRLVAAQALRGRWQHTLDARAEPLFRVANRPAAYARGRTRAAVRTPSAPRAIHPRGSGQSRVATPG